jgi:hypothetical protein
MEKKNVNQPDKKDWAREPKRTPGKAEGIDEGESLSASREPGRTPGQAEGTEEAVEDSLRENEKKR